jgi:hypothetical protein
MLLECHGKSIQSLVDMIQRAAVFQIFPAPDNLVTTVETSPFLYS